MTIIVTYLAPGSIKNQPTPPSPFQTNTSDATMEYKNDTAYKTFAFLYGAIPTAPTVLVYATKYNFGEELVCYKFFLSL